MTKLFLELEFQRKGNKQTETGLIISKLLRFFRQERIQEIKLIKCYTEKDKKKWTDLSLLGQEPTFKVCIFNSITGNNSVKNVDEGTVTFACTSPDDNFTRKSL